MHRNQEYQNSVKVNRSYLSLSFLSIHILSWYNDDGNWKVKGWKDFRNQEKDDQERIDKSALVVGLYNHGSCVLVTN